MGEAAWVRASTYAAIARGVRGIIFFRDGMLHQKETDRVANELRYLSDVLVFGKREPVEHAAEEQVTSARFHHDMNGDGIQEVYHLICNTSDADNRTNVPTMAGYDHFELFNEHESGSATSVDLANIELLPYEVKVIRSIAKNDIAYPAQPNGSK